jgi:DNA-binding LacI/PurR family transcriptional regulator
MISMDNIEMSAYVSPMLTTVGMPIIEIGNVAVGTLIGRIQKHHKLPLKVYLPNKLLQRESVSNLNEGMYI